MTNRVKCLYATAQKPMNSCQVVLGVVIPFVTGIGKQYHFLVVDASCRSEGATAVTSFAIIAANDHSEDLQQLDTNFYLL